MTQQKSRRGARPWSLAACLLVLWAGVPPFARGQAPPKAPAHDSPASTTTTPASMPVPTVSPTPLLTVESDPPGVVVTLHGPFDWVGFTPWKLYRDVSGVYEVTAKRPGYETWKGEVVLGEGGVRELKINLSRRTAPKALLRSIVIPGWGQVYRGSTAKGVGFFLTNAAAFTGWAIVHHNYNNAVDDFNSAKRYYEEATSLDEMNDRWPDVKNASSHADGVYNTEQIWAGIAIGLYALNLVDVVIFGPSGDAETSGMISDAGSGESSRKTADTAGLHWSVGVEPTGAAQAACTWRWN